MRIGLPTDQSLGRFAVRFLGAHMNSNMFSGNQMKKYFGTNLPEKNLMEDSEFMLEASKLLQTAEQQLRKIQSLSSPVKLQDKNLYFNSGSCNEEEYLKQLVEAALNGYTVKKEDFFQIPFHLKNNFQHSVLPGASTKIKENGMKIETAIHNNIKKSKNLKEVSKKCVISKNKPNLEEIGFLNQNVTIFPGACSDLYKYSKEDSLTHHAIVRKSSLSDSDAENQMKQSTIFDADLKKGKNISNLGLVKKKINIENQTCSSKNEKKSSLSCVNTALINISSKENSLENENENNDASRTNERLLTIQNLPCISIKPDLTKQTFTHVHIPPSSSSNKKLSSNKNVAFFEITYNEKCSKTQSGGTSSVKERSSEVEPVVRNAQESRTVLKACILANKTNGGVKNVEKNMIARKRTLTSEKLDNDGKRLQLIIDTATQKLVNCVEIPDDDIEIAVNRLWTLTEILDKVYKNAKNDNEFRINLNFTSVWLHEIVQLIDVEMKQNSNVRPSERINSVVHYLISEIHFPYSASSHQPCIIGKKDGQIAFYCHHDLVSNRVSTLNSKCQSSFETNSMERPESSVQNLSITRETGKNVPNSFTNIYSVRPLKAPAKLPSSYSRSIIETKSIPSRLPFSSLKNRASIRTKKSKFSFNTSDSMNLPKTCQTSKIPTTFSVDRSYSDKISGFSENSTAMDADQRLKVIKKLGEEVERGIQWQEKMLQSSHLEEFLNVPVCADSSNVFTEENREDISLPDRVPQPSSNLFVAKTVNEEMNSAVRTCDAEIQCQLSHSDINPKAKNKIKETPQNYLVKEESSTSSRDTEYDEDWEEDVNSSNKIENNTQFQGCSSSSRGSLNLETIGRNDGIELRGTEMATAKSDGNSCFDRSATYSASTHATREDAVLNPSSKSSQNTFNNMSCSANKIKNPIASFFEESKTSVVPDLEDSSLNASSKLVPLTDKNADFTVNVCSSLKSCRNSEGKQLKYKIKSSTISNCGSDTDIASDFSLNNEEGNESGDSQTFKFNSKKSGDSEIVTDLDFQTSEATKVGDQTLSLVIKEAYSVDNDCENVEKLNQCIHDLSPECNLKLTSLKSESLSRRENLHEKNSSKSKSVWENQIDSETNFTGLEEMIIILSNTLPFSDLNLKSSINTNSGEKGLWEDEVIAEKLEQFLLEKDYESNQRSSFSSHTGTKVIDQSKKVLNKSSETIQETGVSVKLCQCSQELAERVTHLEQVKNDLLRGLISPSNKSLQKFFYEQTFNEVLRKSGAVHGLDKREVETQTQLVSSVCSGNNIDREMLKFRKKLDVGNLQVIPNYSKSCSSNLISDVNSTLTSSGNNTQNNVLNEETGVVSLYVDDSQNLSPVLKATFLRSCTNLEEFVDHNLSKNRENGKQAASSCLDSEHDFNPSKKKNHTNGEQAAGSCLDSEHDFNPSKKENHTNGEQAAGSCLDSEHDFKPSKKENHTNGEQAANTGLNSRNYFNPPNTASPFACPSKCLSAEELNEEELKSASESSCFDGSTATNTSTNSTETVNVESKSFLELFSEILDHSVKESKLLAQLETSSKAYRTTLRTSQEHLVFENDCFNKPADFLSKKCENNFKLYSPVEDNFYESDSSDVSGTNSAYEFEHLMSKLSENLDPNGNEFYDSDSFENLFSVISSERYKLDSDTNLNSSNNDPLCNVSLCDEEYIFERL